MNQTNSDDMNFEYFGIDCQNIQAEPAEKIAGGEDKPRTLRADSRLRSAEFSTPATEKLRSTLSDWFQSLNLNLTMKARNTQCKFNGHVVSEHHKYGHYPRCSQCGKTITNPSTLRRTSITSGGAVNGQVIVPSSDYWIDPGLLGR